jgi:hypothetical protein
MADFAADLCKIVSDKKVTGKTGKGGKKRKLGPKTSSVLNQPAMASSSPGGASSSLGTSKITSPTMTQKLKQPKVEIHVVDLEMEKPFVLPLVVTDKEFFEKKPLQVAAVEKTAILEMEQEVCRDQILEDTTGLLRLLETVLVLNEDRGSKTQELKLLREAHAKLEVENMGLENEVIALRGKQEKFVAQAKENRELKEELANCPRREKNLRKKSSL